MSEELGSQVQTGLISYKGLTLTAGPTPTSVEIGPAEGDVVLRGETRLVTVGTFEGNINQVDSVVPIRVQRQTVVGTRFGISRFTHFLVDKDGVVSQTGSSDFPWPDEDERRNFIHLGTAVHDEGNTFFERIENAFRSRRGLLDTFVDVLETSGSIKSVRGNKVSPNGANLSIDISAGKSIRYGGNFKSRTRPHTSDDPEITLAEFSPISRDADGMVFREPVSILDTSQYQRLQDTTLMVVPDDKFTIQRVWRFTSSGTIGIQYGSHLYGTLNSARANILNEAYNEDPALIPAIFIGYIIIKKGVTDLTAAIADGDALIINWGGPTRPQSLNADDTELSTAFVPARAVYKHLATQAFVSAVETTLEFDTVESELNMVLAGNEVTFEISGTYEAHIESQFTRAGGGGGTEFMLWPKKDDGGGFVNIPNSMARFGQGTNGISNVVGKLYKLKVVAGEKILLKAQTDMSNAEFTFTAAAGSKPAIPASTLTIERVHD